MSKKTWWRLHESAIIKLGFDPIAFVARHPWWFYAPARAAAEPDELTGCKEAARVLGRSVRWVHANLSRLPHRAVNGRVVLFSRAALSQLAQRKDCETGQPA